MPRKRNPNASQRKAPKKSAVGSDDETLFGGLEEPDPNEESYFNDDIDKYHLEQEKILLKELHQEEQDSEEDEEVLALPDDESSDEDENVKYFKALAKKNEMASDIEDEEEELPSDMAWEKKKAAFYNTDYTGDERQGYAGDSDIELAEAEEKEALSIQKRLLEHMDDSAYGLDWIQSMKLSKTEKDVTTVKVQQDFSAMEKEEKMQLLEKESPELIFFIEEFNKRFEEFLTRLSPLLPLIKDGRLPAGAASDIIKCKAQIILQYCTNISFYFVLKAGKKPVGNHPVIRCLLTYGNMLKQIEGMENNLQIQIDEVLDCLKEGKEIPQYKPVRDEVEIQQEMDQKRVQLKDEYRKKLRALEIMEQQFQDQLNDKKEVKNNKPESKKRKLEDMTEMLSSDDSEEESEAEEPEETPEVEGTEEEKRAVTYEIAKNKGLTPYRKKEYRNPRVRHRMKFKKANIRRKGQVREVRNEVQRYGGEISGIRAGISRSVKLK